MHSTRLKQGDIKGYGSTCERTERLVAEQQSPAAVRRNDWTFALGPQALKDLTAPLERMRNVVGLQTSDVDLGRPWEHCCTALASTVPDWIEMNLLGAEASALLASE
jgi:hypothetical protein